MVVGSPGNALWWLGHLICPPGTQHNLVGRCAVKMTTGQTPLSGSVGVTWGLHSSVAKDAAEIGCHTHDSEEGLASLPYFFLICFIAQEEICLRKKI